MPAKTPKVPEFLTISILDEPEVDLITNSLNRTLPEALGAMFMLWAAAVKANAHENEWILGMNYTQIDLMVGIPGFSQALASVRWLQKLEVGGIGAVRILRMTTKRRSKAKTRIIDNIDPELLTHTEQENGQNDKNPSFPLSPLLSSPRPSSSPSSPPSGPPSFLSPTPPLYTPTHTPTLTPTPTPTPHLFSTPYPPTTPSKSHLRKISDECQTEIFERQLSAESDQTSSCFAAPPPCVVSIRKPFGERHPEINQTLNSDNESLKTQAETLAWLFVKCYSGHGAYNRMTFFKQVYGTIFEIVRLRVSPIALKYEILSNDRDRSEPIWKLSSRAEKYLIDPRFGSYDDVESDYIYHYGKLEDSSDPNGWVSGLEKELERNQICPKEERNVG